uniref:Uncharacterized protein n=1 Tax=Megaselia scalaris TaxID=36166 RepID=T1GLT6_MEGSC
MILLILLCCGCIYGTFYSKGFTGAMITFDKKIGTRQNTTYLYTHTRCPIWLVVFIFGYFLHKTRYSSKKLPWIARFFGWFAAISILFAM